MAENKRRSGCLTILAVAMVVLLTGVLYLALRRDPSVQMTILFENPDGLKKGHRVYLARQNGVPLSGQEIGRVREVTFNPRIDRHEVVVGLDRQYADIVKAPPHSTARIRHYGILDWSRAVEIINHPGEGEAAAAGARIEGIASDVEEQMFVTRARPGDFLAEARSGLSSLAAEAQQKLREAEALLTGPEAQRLKADIESLRADIEATGREAAREAGAAADRAMVKGRQVARDLETYGRTDLARDVDQMLAGLRERVAAIRDAGSRDGGSPEIGIIVAPTTGEDEVTSPAATTTTNGGPLP